MNIYHLFCLFFVFLLQLLSAQENSFEANLQKAGTQKILLKTPMHGNQSTYKSSWFIFEDISNPNHFKVKEKIVIKHIKKLIHPLKEEEELLDILKVKLTKKELKLLKAWANETPQVEIQTKLSLDEEQYGALSLKLIKKLNQEKIKQAMCL